MIENRSAPPGPIVPRLIYEDVAKAIDWLCGAFGFTERLRTPAEPGGVIHHAQLAVGMGAVILTGQRLPRTTPVRPAEYIQSLSVHVPDVDAHFERARQFGARILSGPVTHPYGERQYNAEDLAGYQWTFTQSVADVDPKDWGAKPSVIKAHVALLPRPRFCYLELPAVDTGQSLAFYEHVFGWNIRGRDGAHPSFDDAAGSLSGAWTTARASCREPGLLPYIWVDTIEETLALAVRHGAVVVEPPHPDSPGSSSWIATLRDPAGNVIGLYQEDHATP